MREKKDSIFNSEILRETAHLSHSEFGLFIRMAMIEDDDETEKRYENISGVYLSSYMKIEEEWKKEFKKYINDIKMMSDYSKIYSSAAKSRKGYNDLKQKLDAKNDGSGNSESGNTTTPDEVEIESISKESIEFKNKAKPIAIRFTENTKTNAPTQKDIDDLINSFDEDTLVSMIVRGNMERWKRHYDDILIEMTKKGEKEDV